MEEALDKFFSISARGSNVATEIRAGVATFLTMSAILMTNPQILSKAGLPTAAVTSSTALTSCLATLAIGLIANLPFGMAPGMGLNAYFAYNQILDEEIPVDCAFAGCFVAAVAVAILAAVGALGFILRLAPDTIKMAVVVGMGLLLSFIGLQAAHVVVPVKETLVGLGNLQSTNVWLVVFGLSLIVALQYRGFKAAILIGVAATAAGHFLISSDWPQHYVSLPDFKHFGLDFSELLKPNGQAYSAVLAYVLVMVFDIGGAIFGLATLSGLVEADGTVHGTLTTYLAAAGGSALGAATGTTPLILAAESAVGIKQGGRTGLVAVTIAVCFAASLFFAPALQSIPSFATSPVLILVGMMMMSESANIDWTHIPTALPAFLTIMIQPFTFSVANGIYAGLLFSFILKAMCGDPYQGFRSFQNTVWAWAGWKSMSPDTSQRSALDPSHRFAYDASVRSAFDASQRSARDASQRSAREPLFREPLLREPLLREPLLNGQEQREPAGQQQC
mmetsp:Transcript_7551/g.20098  ORF Transcript_7551/g.20098 Transcript_7551/m.20098 type:complete len:506 (-) Transcript_7551:990-2507(-)